MVKKLIKKISLSTKALSVLRNRKIKAIILRYHSVKEDTNKHAHYIGGISISCKCFEEQMKIISRYYESINIDELFKVIMYGGDSSKKFVCVTFDDGFKDNAQNAMPIMNKFGISGSIYVSTSFIKNGYLWFLLVRNAFSKTQKKIWLDKSTGKIFNLLDQHDNRNAFLRSVAICSSLSFEDVDFYVKNLLDDLEVYEDLGDGAKPLSQDELLCMRSHGHVIGSHTVSHCNMAHINTSQMRIEADNSKLFLENLLSEEIIHFSYPSPYLTPIHNENTKKILISSGYKTAVTCDHGVVNEDTDIFSIPRCVVPHNIVDFQFMLDKLFFVGK